MNAITATTYASKNSAVRAAKRAGLTDCIIELVNGRWVIVANETRFSTGPLATGAGIEGRQEKSAHLVNCQPCRLHMGVVGAGRPCETAAS